MSTGEAVVNVAVAPNVTNVSSAAMASALGTTRSATVASAVAIRAEHAAL